MTVLDLAEAQIAVHWKEEEAIPPPPSFIAQANLTDPDVDRRFALENFPECYAEYGEMLTWFERWEKILDDSTPPFWKWFTGGVINASVNCIDRHLPRKAARAAFLFVPELESEPVETITYQDLYDRVNEVAAVLRDVCGVRRAHGVVCTRDLRLRLVSEVVEVRGRPAPSLRPPHSGSCNLSCLGIATQLE